VGGGITGIPAETIRQLAHEMGVTARDQKIELPIAWTDCWGKRTRQRHRQPGGLPRHARAGAHSNGFQTMRSLAILMSLLGTIDRPGGFRHKAPYPRAVPPNAPPPKGPAGDQAEHAAERRAAGLARVARTTCASTRTASRCASTRASPGSTRCRPTG
jgi:anaerobic selenocysteine-containing dehydrogenase